MSESENRHSVIDIRGKIDYDVDPQGCLAYWDIVGGKYQVLEPTQPIADPHCIIGKVGQQNLLPGHFTLKPKDLELTEITRETGEVVGDPILPGLSTFLFFGSVQSRQHDIQSLSQSTLGREPTKKNRVYFTQVRDIEQAGWTAIYAPLINKNKPPVNPLHVILVPNSIRSSGELLDAQECEKIALVSAFIKWTS